MSQIVFKNGLVERAVDAWLKIQGIDISKALQTQSIDQIAVQAIQSQIQLGVSKGNLAEDVRSLIGYQEYFNAVWQRFHQDETLPESLVVALEARAAELAPIPAGQ